MMKKIGLRLKQERQKLGMTQGALANIGGVQANAQGKYERGVRSPNAVYLAQLASLGVDVLYVVTGRRAAPHLSDSRISDLDFLEQLSMLSARERKAVIDLMSCLTKIR